MTVQLVAQHPILAALDSVETAFGEAADLQPVYLTTAEKQDALRRLAALGAQAAELRLRVLAVSDEVGEEAGARDAAAWVSVETRADSDVARADVRLAKALESRPLVAAAMREGRVSVAQARVIVAGIDALPAALGPELASEAEATLVGHAASYRPRELRRLARRILDVVAPEIAEAEEGKRLEVEEQRARDKASLHFRDLGDGRARVWGTVPTAVAERFKHYLHAWTSPRKGRRERGRQARAYAEALAALLEAFDPDRMPDQGGEPTTVVVTMTLEQLVAELATAGVVLGDGELEVSATEARRLACQSGIVPMVLGGRGEVLDVGRRSRLHTRVQRTAIRARDRQCRAEGCDIPATWSEIHHRRPWGEGGTTTVEDGICVCPHHHHVLHDHRYEHEWLANGDVRFRRRG